MLWLMDRCLSVARFVSSRFESPLWAVGWRLSNPDFCFAFYPDSLLCLHQVDLCLDASVISSLELISRSVFQLGYWDVFGGSDFVPEALLYFFSFLSIFRFRALGHFWLTVSFWVFFQPTLGLFIFSFDVRPYFGARALPKVGFLP